MRFAPALFTPDPKAAEKIIEFFSGREHHQQAAAVGFVALKSLSIRKAVRRFRSFARSYTNSRQSSRPIRAAAR